jgi:hypothetical protein
MGFDLERDSRHFADCPDYQKQFPQPSTEQAAPTPPKPSRSQRRRMRKAAEKKK